MIGNGPQVGVQRLQFAVATIMPLPSTSVTWTIAFTGKADPNSEEGWTLLPNGQVLTVDTQNGSAAELFNPATKSWGPAGNTPSISGPRPRPRFRLARVCLKWARGWELASTWSSWSGLPRIPRCSLFRRAAWPDRGGPARRPDKLSRAVQGTSDGPCVLVAKMGMCSFQQTSNGFMLPSSFWELASTNVTPRNPVVGGRLPRSTTLCARSSVAAYQSRMLLIPTCEVCGTAGLEWEWQHRVLVLYSKNAGDGTFNNVMCPPPHIFTISVMALMGVAPIRRSGPTPTNLSQGAMHGDDGGNGDKLSDGPYHGNIFMNAHGVGTDPHNWAILTSTQFDAPL